jgi:hypothetical protein
MRFPSNIESESLDLNETRRFPTRCRAPLNYANEFAVSLSFNYHKKSIDFAHAVLSGIEKKSARASRAACAVYLADQTPIGTDKLTRVT